MFASDGQLISQWGGVLEVAGVPPVMGGTGREALGRSRGGLTTKIHLVADRRCRPVARILSPGQHGDSPRFKSFAVRPCSHCLPPTTTARDQEHSESTEK